MRRRITKALLAAAAAGATIASLGLAVSPAGAATAGQHHAGYFTPSGGTPVPTNANCLSPGITPAADTVGSPDACGMAGYEATGRDFRFVQGEGTVPDHYGTLGDQWEYVALDGSTASTSNWARAGFIPCACGTSGWEGFYATWETGPGEVIQAFPLPVADEGDGITFNAYEVPSGNAVQFSFTLPGGQVSNFTLKLNGQETYTRAEWLTDWSIDPGPAPAAPSSKTRVTQFFGARATTWSGSQGTIRGPWTTTGVQATSNGHLPPSGTLIGDPAPLWNDGSSYHGLGSDAFGVWLYPF